MGDQLGQRKGKEIPIGSGRLPLQPRMRDGYWVPILDASLEGREVEGLEVGGRRGEGHCRGFFRMGAGYRMVLEEEVVGILHRRGVVGKASPGVGDYSLDSRTWWRCKKEEEEKMIRREREGKEGFKSE